MSFVFLLALWRGLEVLLGTSPCLELCHFRDNDSSCYHCQASEGDSAAESIPLNVTVLNVRGPQHPPIAAIPPSPHRWHPTLSNGHHRTQFCANRTFWFWVSFTHSLPFLPHSTPSLYPYPTLGASPSLQPQACLCPCSACGQCHHHSRSPVTPGAHR